MGASGENKVGRRKADRQWATLLDCLAAVHMDLAPLCSVKLHPEPIDRAQIKRARDDLELALKIVRELEVDSIEPR